MRTFENVMQSVREELGRAVLKFPTFPTDPIHAAGIIAEECGELQKAVTQLTYEHRGAWDECQVEATQTAAMAVRFLMHLGDMLPRPSKQTLTILDTPETAGGEGHGQASE